MPAFSLLDLCPIVAGSNPSESLKRSLILAQHAEALGFKRYWVAEHHNMPGIASAATAVVLGHIAAGTAHIRVGAGGVMLPNHSPLVIAEQFGTLEALYPGRIDLGLGRAPGSDQLTLAAMRRSNSGAADQFPQDVSELLALLSTPTAQQAIIATPGANTHIPIWILGSSTFGARLAAEFGLPYAFASHFAPQELDHALQVYRHYFKPSAQLKKPYAIVATNVVAAKTDEQAQFLASSMQQSFINLLSGKASQLNPPIQNYLSSLSDSHQYALSEKFSCSAIGSADTVRSKLVDIIDRTQADELMLTAMVYDAEAYLNSCQIAADILKAINAQ